MQTAAEIRQRIHNRYGIKPLSPKPFRITDLSIVNKQDQLVPFVPNRLQKKYLENRTGRDLILKPRQMGVSVIIGADCTVEAMNTTLNIATLAHDEPTTQRLRRMAAGFWKSLPDDRRPRRILDNASTVTYADTGSEITIATAGSPNLGRGGRYTRIHGSEVAYWKDAAGIMAGIIQGVPSHGWIELESTPNGAQGWFYDQCIAALRGDSIWTLHFFEWWWDDDYKLVLEPGEVITYTDDEKRLANKYGLSSEQIKWRRYKQKELGYLFIQEYPEDIVSCFLTSGNSVFGDFAHALYSAIPNDKPIDGHDYVGGIDWGQSKNFTALSIIDATDNREVVLWRKNQTRWDEMRREMIELCDYWHVGHLYVEKNSASSNVENIQNEIEQLQKDRPLADGRTGVIAFTTTNKRKAEMVNTLYQGIHEDGLQLLDIPYATAELRQYQSVQTSQGVWTYDCPETSDGAHGDTVIARMAAYWGSMRRIPKEW